MPYASYLAQALVAVVFVCAAAAKLRDLPAFARYLDDLHVLPSALSAPAARCLAIAEFVAGLLCAVPATAPVGLSVAVVLLLMLSAGIAVLLRRGTGDECACFGRRRAPLATHHLLRNGVLAVIAASGLVATQLHHPAAHWAGIGIAVAAGAIGAVLIGSWDDIADLLDPSPPSSKGQSHAISRRGRGGTGPARRDRPAVDVGDPAAAAKPQ